MIERRLSGTVTTPPDPHRNDERTLPEEAEAGGGLMVATIQLAITLGASAGGFLFDTSDYRRTFAASAALLCGSALLAFGTWRAGLHGSGQSRPADDGIVVDAVLAARDLT